MKNRILTMKNCPRCGKAYCGVPAISRTDGKTAICPDCGTREALGSIGVEASEQEKILERIHRYSRGHSAQ